MTKPLYVRSGKGRVWHLVLWGNVKWVKGGSDPWYTCGRWGYDYEERTYAPGRVCKSCLANAERRCTGRLKVDRFTGEITPPGPKEVKYLEAAIKSAEAGA